LFWSTGLGSSFLSRLYHPPMLARLKRTSVSFLAVVAVFVVYRLTAVPFIEPAKQIKRVAPVSPEKRLTSRQPQNHLGGYARFFPEGTWERDNPIVLESETSKLLLKEYVTLPDGHLKLNPCTVIYLPEGEAEAADSHRRVIILQAPEGAELKFDQPVDLGRGKIGRLEGGVMSGPVFIQSGPTKPEGGDDFFAVTRDVQMKDNLIFTSAEVDFRFGASQGHGREMRIELLPGPPGNNNHGTNFGGVQSLQLLTDVRMHLQPSSGGFVPGDQNPAATQKTSQRTVIFSGQTGSTTDTANNPPVDIRCQGPFEFDLVQNVATFHDRVDVVRPHAYGPSDQINGELLNLYFAPREPANGASPGNVPAGNPQQPVGSAAHGLPQLEPRRLVVRGNPVVVRSDSMGGEIRGEHLEYDILARHMMMEAPGAKVQIESPDLSGQVSRLEAWTRDAQPVEQSSPADQSAAAGRAAGRNGGPNSSPNQSQNAPRQHNEIYGEVLQIWSISSPSGNAIDRITVDGNVRFLQSAATPGDKPLETKGDFLEVLRAAAVDAEVAISGRPAEVSTQGLTMVGQTVHLNRGENRVWIDGVGRMIVTGDPSTQGGISPNQSTQIDPRAGADRNALFASNRGTTTVDWQRGMVFDGRTVKFDGNVVGEQIDGEITQTVRAPQMDVTLQSGVDFNAVGPQQRQRPQIEWLTCRGDVWLENRQTEQGKLINLDRMEHLSTLTVNQITGELSGQATTEQPGRVLSWRLGSPPAFATGLGSSAPTTGNSSDSNRAQINFLDVQFARGISGNVLPDRQEMTFHEQVRCVYGPVAGWDTQLDADSPAGLPAGSMVMTCDQLTTNQSAARSEGRGQMEMDARGNIRVDGQRLEGDSFSALAQHLTYSQAKDMLVLVGDGRADAQLVRQEQPGAPQTKTAAGSIYYWPTTRQVKVGDLRFVDSTQFSSQPPRTPAAPGATVSSPAAPRSSTVQPVAAPPRR
jgi:lipopolysaccharide export system protein LptA